jgi:hypothetical protein
MAREHTSVWVAPSRREGARALLRQHELRDFAQRLPRCHDYLRRGSAWWRDAWWQLCCELVLDWPFVFFGVCARVTAGGFGHWLVGYLAHNRGERVHEVRGAAARARPRLRTGARGQSTLHNNKERSGLKPVCWHGRRCVHHYSHGFFVPGCSSRRPTGLWPTPLATCRSYALRPPPAMTVRSCSF